MNDGVGDESMLVIQPWEEVYGVPCEAKMHGKYLHIAVKKAFWGEVAAEIARGESFEFKRIQGHWSKPAAPPTSA